MCAVRQGILDCVRDNKSVILAKRIFCVRDYIESMLLTAACTRSFGGSNLMIILSRSHAFIEPVSRDIVSTSSQYLLPYVAMQYAICIPSADSNF